MNSFAVAIRRFSLSAPSLPLPRLSTDRELARVEGVLADHVRLAVLRARGGDWEARPFDPRTPKRYDEVGRGETPAHALRDLHAQLVDPVVRATRV